MVASVKRGRAIIIHKNLFSSVAGKGSFGGAGALVRNGQPHSALAPTKFFGGIHSSSAIVSVDVPFNPAKFPWLLVAPHNGGGNGKYGGIVLISTNVSLLRNIDCSSLTT